MRPIKLFICPLLVCTSVLHPALSMTMISSDASQNMKPTVIRYDLQGTITRWLPNKSLLYINRKAYDYTPSVLQADLKLRKGLRIHFNMEKNPDKPRGRITRIWTKVEHK